MWVTIVLSGSLTLFTFEWWSICDYKCVESLQTEPIEHFEFQNFSLNRILILPERFLKVSCRTLHHFEYFFECFSNIVFDDIGSSIAAKRQLFKLTNSILPGSESVCTINSVQIEPPIGIHYQLGSITDGNLPSTLPWCWSSLPSFGLRLSGASYKTF